MRRRSIAFLAATALATIAPPPSVAQQSVAATTATVPGDPFNGFSEFVQSLLDEFHVPGVAVAAIQDGEVVLAEGFGYRNLEEQLPMTPRTLLAIGSNTKSFTVTLLGTLVDEGKLEWNEPLRTYLPDFRLHDETATINFTVRDLVIHRSGLPRHDLMWYGRSSTRDEIFQRLRYLEPTTTLRNRYQYQNLMFMTAGLLAERITGKSWEQLVRERIFQPLGMTRSNLSVSDMPHSDDYAVPHMMRDDEVRVIPYRNIDEIGPAGSINSSAEEMLRYIQMHLNGGELDGTRLLSDSTSANMQRPYSTTGGRWRFPELGYSAYGMGLSITSYQGRKVVQHGGGIDGFISSMSWMPQANIGVIVLTNFSGVNPVPNIIKWNVYDRLLGVEPVDWLARTRADLERAEENRERRRREVEEKHAEGTSPSHPLDAYAGTYEHAAYGTATVQLENGSLTVALDRFRGVLEHYHYDVFEIDAEPGDALGGMRVMFLYNKDGEIDRLLMPMEPAVGDIVFERAR